MHGFRILINNFIVKQVVWLKMNYEGVRTNSKSLGSRYAVFASPKERGYHFALWEFHPELGEYLSNSGTELLLPFFAFCQHWGSRNNVKCFIDEVIETGQSNVHLCTSAEATQNLKGVSSPPAFLISISCGEALGQVTWLWFLNAKQHNGRKACGAEERICDKPQQNRPSTSSPVSCSAGRLLTTEATLIVNRLERFIMELPTK